LTQTHQPSVAVAGAGLAGLTLAQRLLREGFDVTVFERDSTPFGRPQGNRITVDRHGLEALRRSLAPHRYDAVLRTSGPPGGSFRVTNAQLRDAFVKRFDPASASERQVDREVLRRILLDGLDDSLRFGHPVQSVRALPERVVVELGNGGSVEADVAVVADGIGSTVRRSVLPDAEPVDTGVGAVYGRSPLRRGGRQALPHELLDSGVLALLDEPTAAFFFTAMRFQQEPLQAFPACGLTVSAPQVEDYVMWGLVLTSDQLWAAGRDPAPRRLLELAADGVARAHPLLLSLVEGTDPASVLLSRFSSGTRPAFPPPARVAVLGDAIHPMPPFGAHGGNTALRDASNLGEHLAGARHGGAQVAPALAAYHDDMVGYAFAEVDAAVSQMRRLGSSSPVSRLLLRRLLPALHRRSIPRGWSPVGSAPAAELRPGR
jgi:2-polyprenyl-6-methoxyphenol hydroxylase-like FAD-dependent oxidoreductase